MFEQFMSQQDAIQVLLLCCGLPLLCSTIAGVILLLTGSKNAPSDPNEN